ncbi:hypothetical protein BG011_009067 [Mortierella polycephala]|uniref:Chromo domain-containing protein n=1 Tax=Mortierella polycephala TaxID=41804 RepID=A0A9P6TWJ6_9FUNG|nr:hypothetical protein BG011_009067 [Mortierella polycephala]
MPENITQDICLVDKILEKRTNADTGAVEYLIHWQGTDAQGNEYEDSWEPECNIIGDELIEEYDRMHRTKRVQQHRRSPSNNGSYGSIHGTNGSHGPRHQQQAVPPLPLQMNPRHAYSSIPPEASIRLPSTFIPPQQPVTGHPDIHQAAPGTFSRPFVGYAQGYPHPYPPVYSHLPHPYPIPSHYAMHPTHHRPESGMSNMRTRQPSSHSKPLKRVATSTAADGSKDVEMSGPATSGAATQLPSTQDDLKGDASAVGQESNSAAGTKRSRQDGHSVRSHYMDRRQALSINRSAPATIRLLKLDFDHEKVFFISLIAKSTLVKDAAIREDMVRFLKNPQNPELAPGASLLESETWLIELKEQHGTPGSFFLALDIPNGVVKALFIPEWMLEYRRRDHPGQGVVVVDRAIVSAIMAGDLHGSGLYPPSATQPVPSNSELEANSSLPTTATEPSNTSGPPAQPLPQQDDSKQESIANKQGTMPTTPAINGDVMMESAEGSEGKPKEPTSVSEIQCGWENCREVRLSMKALSVHVQQAHLQGLLSSMSEPTPSADQLDGTNMSSTPSAVVDASSTDQSPMDIAWKNQYKLLEDAYRSLQDDIVKMKGTMLRTEEQLRESTVLYTGAIAGSEEHIKRLEAHLEWEMKKWEKYQSQRRHMISRNVGDSEPTSNANVVDGAQERASENLSGPNGKEEIDRVPDHEEDRMDKPMEAQSFNSIREIQKQLVAAKEAHERLAQDNAALFAKRRTLETEFRKIDERYQQTTSQLTALEAKDQEAVEEIRQRTRNIEDYKTAMEKDQEQHQRDAGQLQSMIGSLMQTPSQHAQQRDQQQYPSSMPPTTPNLAPPGSLAAQPPAQPTPEQSMDNRNSSSILSSTVTNEPSKQGMTTAPEGNIPSNFIDLLTRQLAGPESQ